jgi:hypothetical protein
MKLKPIGSNMTELNTNGISILFSYETPVAGYDSNGAFRTDKHYSSTTTRHINKYLGKGTGRLVSQEFINNLVN